MAHFLIFCGKFFLKKSGSVTLNLKYVPNTVSIDPFPKKDKKTEAQTEGQKDGETDPVSLDHSNYCRGSNKYDWIYLK